MAWTFSEGLADRRALSIVGVHTVVIPSATFARENKRYAQDTGNIDHSAS